MKKKPARKRAARSTAPSPAAAVAKKPAAKSRALCKVCDWSGERKCRVCGCTNDDCIQCIRATGAPCHWVEWNLCSRCAAEDAA